MAKRPIFVPYSEGQRLVREVEVEFTWYPGFAAVQKKKSMAALHQAAREKGIEPVLEVSTKSDFALGQRLSAFNLTVRLGDGSSTSLESAFQGSKVFEHGGPFQDIYRGDSRDAKRDERLRASGGIRLFRFEEINFPSEPKTAFYDWLYAKALAGRPDDMAELERFAGFSDIEFNPEKSINCQARSCAIVVSLRRKGLFDHAISSPIHFIETVSADSFSQPYSKDLKQRHLF